MRSLGFLLSWLLASALGGADLPDPTTSWHPRHAIATLAALRGPLDAQPNDPALLAAAQMAYVELCFMAEPDLCGALGPWLERAREISLRRRQARGEAPWTTLAEAAPDLWLAAIEGRTLAVMDALSAWPAEAQSPHARALRALASCNPTVFTEQPPETPLERYAYLRTCAATGISPRLLTPQQQTSDSDPFVSYLIRQENDGWNDSRAAIREVLVDIAWMLNSAEIADPVAFQALQALTEAYGDRAAPQGGRAQRVSIAMRAARTCDTRRAEPIIAAWKACRSLRGAGSMMSSDGRHRMVGVPEVAAWNLDRLYVVVIHQMLYLSDRERAPLSAAYDAGIPGSLVAARAAYRKKSSDPTPIQADGLATAITRCLAGEEGSSPAVAAWALQRLPESHAAVATPLIMQAYQRLYPPGSPPGQSLILSLWRAAVRAGCTPHLVKHLVAAAQADPFNQELFKEARAVDRKRPLVPVGTVPVTLQRIEAVLDIPAMPVPDSNLKQFVFGRWQGHVRLDSGATRIAIESDDGARLFLADDVLLNLGQHPMRIREMTIEPTSSGWLPLHLEWYNAWSGGGIRLLWRPAGATAWAPIPADRLAHGGERQPGLEAQYWQLGSNLVDLLAAPHADDLRRVEMMPWHYRAKGDLGIALIDANRAQEALPFLREACRQDHPNFFTEQALIRALAAVGTPEVADELAEAFHAQPCQLGDVLRANWIGLQMAQAGSELRIGQLSTGRPLGCCVEDLPLGYMALCRADWQQAIAYFTKLQANNKLDRPRHRWLREHMSMVKAILQRLTIRQEPDWDAWREFSMDSATTPYIRLFAKWYTGQISWEEATARRQTTEDGDGILWLHALHGCTLGEHDQAQRNLRELVKAHPTWGESSLASGLLRWYGRQTPESLAALATAAPLPAQRGTPTPEEKPNF